jgi:putative phage-type endonuclease
VTASDVATICGENPFQTRKCVLFTKTFRIPFEGNEATEWGKHYEPIAIEKFCQKTGAVVQYPSYTKHKTYNWFGGTLDGIAVMPDGTRCILEVKCPLKRAIKDEVPVHYYGQVQSYMEIYDLDKCLFVQYKPAGPRSEEKLMITSVDRDRGYIEQRLPSLFSFWREMIILQAQTERIIVVIQRAWRAYLSNKSAKEAARSGMIARLRCATMLGKLSGFARKRAIASTRMLPIENSGGRMLVEIGTYPLAPSGFYGRSQLPVKKEGEKIYLEF